MPLLSTSMRNNRWYGRHLGSSDSHTSGGNALLNMPDHNEPYHTAQRNPGTNDGHWSMASDDQTTPDRDASCLTVWDLMKAQPLARTISHTTNIKGKIKLKLELVDKIDKMNRHPLLTQFVLAFHWSESFIHLDLPTTAGTEWVRTLITITNY